MDGCFGGVLGPPQLSQLNSPKYCEKKNSHANSFGRSFSRNFVLLSTEIQTVPVGATDEEVSLAFNKSNNI